MCLDTTVSTILHTYNDLLIYLATSHVQSDSDFTSNQLDCALNVPHQPLVVLRNRSLVRFDASAQNTRETMFLQKQPAGRNCGPCTLRRKGYAAVRQ
jgi:hypothetical protein